MVQYGYRRGGAFNLPTPSLSSLSAQITPPEGKALSDFVCWVGFKKNGVDDSGKFTWNSIDNIPLSNNYGTLYFPSSNGLTDSQITFAEVTNAFNLYAEWDKFAWDSKGASKLLINCF